MKLKTHRKRDHGYLVEIEDAAGNVHEFEWPADPPEGVSRAAYEKQQQREAALLVKDRLDRSKPAAPGAKVTGEGTDLTKLLT